MQVKKIKTLIVDDSALVRQTLTEVLLSDPEIEVMGTASDPFIAAKKIEIQMPDVIILDIEMPKMDGLTFLKKIMSQRPIPVVICSSLTESGSKTALKALESGAVEIIQKPRLGSRNFLIESTVRICDAVKSACIAKIRPVSVSNLEIAPKYNADVIIKKPDSGLEFETTEKIVVVGASTGGTEALRVFLEAMPADAPGIIIVQHMPEHFTAAFSKRLNDLCRITVREAKNNDAVLSGHALIAPGNQHILVKRSGTQYYVVLKSGPLVNRHRPSVDVLFRSAARYAGKNAVGVIMTGMGDDGAKGLLELKHAGAITIAQDEATSVVFGMPQEAIRLGGAEFVLPLHSISQEIIKIIR